jgi:hypothetical protein
MGRPTPTWKLYERQIFDALRQKAPDAVVEPDARLLGRYSEVDRQIDVLVTGTFPGLDRPQWMVVECKAFSHRVDVKDVEMTFGLVEDVGAPFGLIVTTEGYSQAAKRRAFHCRGLTLEVVPLDDLSRWAPRRPTVAWTTGTDTATVIWRDDHGAMRTDLVTREVAERLVEGMSAEERR